MSRVSSFAAIMAGLVLLALAGSGCAPQIGSEAWCESMSGKPKGDWTANEAADYARHCLLN